MKDESGMNKDIKQATKKISDISAKSPYWSQSYIDIAKWHLKAVKIAEIRGRIAEANYLYQFDRARVLEKELAEAEKGEA